MSHAPAEGPTNETHLFDSISARCPVGKSPTAAPLPSIPIIPQRSCCLSHTVSIKTEVRDAAAVRAACDRLKLPAPVQGKARLFSGEIEGFAVQLPDWVYPVVCDTASGRIKFDNFNGRCGHCPSSYGGSPRCWPTVSRSPIWPAGSVSAMAGFRRSARTSRKDPRRFVPQRQPADAGGTDPLAAIRSINALASADSSAILILTNFHRFLSSPEIVQALARQIALGKSNRTFVIILSPLVQVPVELEKLFVVVEHDLPGREQLEEIARGVATEEADPLNVV